MQRMAVWQRSAFHLDGRYLCLATCVDNLVTIAETPEQAIEIMSDCEDVMLQRWCQRIGSDSKEFLTCRAYQSPINIPGIWSRRTTLKCLGHHLDDDAGIGSCFKACAAAMCRSFYANLTAGLLRASKAAKYKSVNSCVRAIASFRWSRWPFSKTYAMALDALQRKFLTSLMQVRKNDGEPYDAFIQRRHLIGGHLATACGRWSHAWARSVVSWDAHVRRAHDDAAWSHLLLEWHSEPWLMMQRWLHSAPGQSRTKTRAYHGRVQQRWVAGVALAEATVEGAVRA